MPKGGGWIKCNICEGYGTIEIYKSKGLNYGERDQELEESVGCCLESFLTFSSKDEEYERSVEEQKRQGTYRDPPPTSKNYEVEYIKCKKCKGVGWIK